MRIDRLTVRNFKGFREREFLFHPEFNLLVGDNGAGKTSVLDALAVAAGTWFLGLRGFEARQIRPHNVMLDSHEQDITSGQNGRQDIKWERQYPCSVQAKGEVQGQNLSWTRSLNTPTGRTTYGAAKQIKDLSRKADNKIRSRELVLLPLIAYYGPTRLSTVPQEHSQAVEMLPKKERLSRLSGYTNSLDPRLSISELVQWVFQQTLITLQEGGTRTLEFNQVRRAVIDCIVDAADFYFDMRLRDVVVAMKSRGRHPFYDLSDGQRNMVALVADIARKATMLNPDLGDRALTDTPGLVLIDELDLHLHPTWQRRVIEDLRRTFPKLQFFATTHSPFLIQSLRSGEELVMLDGQPTAQLGNKPLEEIAQGIMGVTDPQVSLRYAKMRTAAKRYLETLEEAKKAPPDKLEEFKEKLADTIAPYADNPAYQAFLEMKRAVKLGE